MSEFWTDLLNQFRISVLESHLPEILTEQELRDFEAREGVRLPFQYQKFCMAFGSSMIADSGTQIFCPNRELSEMHLYPFRLELREDFLPEHNIDELDEDLQSVIDLLIEGSPLVFGTDPTTRTYLFDLNSYSESDQSCNIWCICLDGFEDELAMLGRDFRDFFMTFALGQYISVRDSRESVVPLSPEDYALIRINSREIVRSYNSY